MWKPELNLQCPTGRRGKGHGGAMAHRRVLVRGKVTLVAAATIGLTLMLFGSVHISNQVSLMRVTMAALESTQEFEEGCKADLLMTWNAETDAETIVARARRELGLEVRDHPGLVLVRHPSNTGGDGAGVLQKFFARFGGTEARAADDPTSAPAGTMVSLTPRSPGGETGPGSGP